MTRQLLPTLRRRILVGALGFALVGGTLATVLIARGPTQETAGQQDVIPHLMPDVGGLHSESQGTGAAPRVAIHPGIRLIPPAGGPVSAYGGAPSGPTFLPAHNKGLTRRH